jgi:hypothetical protein
MAATNSTGEKSVLSIQMKFAVQRKASAKRA